MELEHEGGVYLKHPEIAKIARRVKAVIGGKKKVLQQVQEFDFWYKRLGDSIAPENQLCPHMLMAIMIYGAIIFPKTKGKVDALVLDMIWQIESGFNPCHAIIAGTIRSLTHCREKGQGRFQSCA